MALFFNAIRAQNLLTFKKFNISIEKTNITIENYLGQVKPQRTVKNIEFDFFPF